jgi:uncharacterized protein (UPF0332 family)
MPFLWTEYLKVARHLKDHSAAGGHLEACLRSAVSRAYYAALNTARNFLRDQWGIEVPEDSTIHIFVPQWFMSGGDGPQQEIGVLLDRLRDRRRKADYEDEIPSVPALANRALADAQLVTDRVSAL